MSRLTPAHILRNGDSVPLAGVTILEQAVFFAAVKQEAAAKGRVIALFASPAGKEFDLFALVAHDRQGTLALLRTRVIDSYPSLTPELPAVHLFEREIAEQYGLIPEGHPWFKPVRFHRSYSDCDAWGRDQQPLIPGDIDYYRVEGGDVHEVAVGPVHAGVIEPGHFRFQCHGEKVMHLEISLGFQHRGLEPLLQGKPGPATVQRLETVAGDSTIAHTTAYARICESLSNTPVPARAEAIRSLALELERLANHVGDIGGLATDVGYLPTASYCGRLRGDYLNLMAAICGSRFGRTLVRPGGVAHDIDKDLADQMSKQLKLVARDTKGALALFFDCPSVLARLEGTGLVAMDDAEALGLVGVAGRACGLAVDARFYHSWGAYTGNFERAVFEETGDVHARAKVRQREIATSTSWVKQALSSLPDTELRNPPGVFAPETLAVTLVEGWRGEVVHVALTDNRGGFSRYKIIDPSFRNWSGLAMALRDEQISDFPLCNKSFNLSYCGFDL